MAFEETVVMAGINAFSNTFTPRKTENKSHNPNSQGRAFCTKISWPLMRTFLIFSISFGLSFLYMSLEYKVSSTNSTYIALVFSLTIALLTLRCKVIRCVAILCLPQLASNVGRILIFSLITWLVVVRPLTTTTLNLKEVSRVANCVGDIAQAQGQQLSAAYSTSYQKVAENIMASIDKFESVSAAVDEIIDPLIGSLQSAQDTLRTVYSELSEAGKNCDIQLNKAMADCQSGVDDFKKFCLKHLDDLLLGFMCESVKFGSATCSAINPDILCSPVNLVSMSHKVQILPPISDELKKIHKMLKVSVRTTKLVISENNVSDSIQKVNTAMNEEFTHKLDRALLIYTVIHYGLTIPWLILLPINAFCFLINTLVSKSKKKCQRKWCQIRCFCINVDFPKRNANKFKKSKSLLKSQFIAVAKAILASIVAIFFIGTLLAVEYALYWALSTARTHATVSFGVSGSINYETDIQAGEIMKPIIDELLNSFKVLQNYSVLISTDDCLPIPVEPTSPWTYLALVCLYLLVLALIFLQEFFLQKRFTLVKWMYPEYFKTVRVRVTTVTSNFKEPKYKASAPPRDDCDADDTTTEMSAFLCRPISPQRYNQSHHVKINRRSL